MPVASNSLMRSTIRSSPIGSVQKSATSRRCHPTNTPALTLGEQNEIVLRGYLGYSADRLFQSVRVLHRGER